MTSWKPEDLAQSTLEDMFPTRQMRQGTDVLIAFGKAMSHLEGARGGKLARGGEGKLARGGEGAARQATSQLPNTAGCKTELTFGCARGVFLALAAIFQVVRVFQLTHSQFVLLDSGSIHEFKALGGGCCAIATVAPLLLHFALLSSEFLPTGPGGSYTSFEPHHQTTPIAAGVSSNFLKLFLVFYTQCAGVSIQFRGHHRHRLR
jgi:hypothetical protein